MKTFSKEDAINWLYKLDKIADNIKETIPSYHIDNIPERYNEAFLKKTKVALKRKRGSSENVDSKLNPTFVVHHCLYLVIFSITPKHIYSHQWRQFP